MTSWDPCFLRMKLLYKIDEHHFFLHFPFCLLGIAHWDSSFSCQVQAKSSTANLKSHSVCLVSLGFEALLRRTS